MDGVLIVFGFSWMIVGALIGLYLVARHEPQLARLEEIARTGSLLEYHRVLDAYKWKVTVHAHSLLFPVLSIFLGLLWPRVNLPPAIASGVAWALMAATVIWTVGGLRLNKPLMGTGDFLLLASLIATAIGLARGL